MSPEPHAGPGEQVGGVRERILDAALAILRAEGIQELTQVQVSRRAGVRQSHLTYYFPKRHDLLEAVGTRFIEGMEQGLRGVAGRIDGDPGDLLHAMAEAVAEHGHMRMFMGMVIAADREPALRALIVRHTVRIQEMLAGVIGGPNAMERAGLLIAAMWGLGLFGFAMGTPAGSASSLLACLAAAPPSANGDSARTATETSHAEEAEEAE